MPQFSEIQTEVFRRCDESSSSPAFWTLTDVKNAINEGAEDLADHTEWREVQTTINLANSIYYDLSVGGSIITDVLLTLTGAYNTQTSRYMDVATVQQLDRWYRRWESVTGAEPERFWTRGISWMGLFPNKGAASGTVKLYYTALPAALSADADTPGFPQEFHFALVDYAVYDLLCQDREYEKAGRFWQSYLAHAENLRRYVQGRASVPMVRRMGG